MRKYSVELSDGTDAKMSYIGLNYTIDGRVLDDIISSYNRYFDNKDEIIITDGNSPRRCGTIGDITKAYELLRIEVASKTPRNAEEYMGCVQRTIELYFGPYAKDKRKRLTFYPTEEEIKNGKERGRISNLGGKIPPLNLAVSLETKHTTTI